MEEAQRRDMRAAVYARTSTDKQLDTWPGEDAANGQEDVGAQ